MDSCWCRSTLEEGCNFVLWPLGEFLFYGDRKFSGHETAIHTPTTAVTEGWDQARPVNVVVDLSTHATWRSGCDEKGAILRVVQ